MYNLLPVRLQVRFPDERQTSIPTKCRANLPFRNYSQVEFPDGRQTLVLMPAKFNKKLWVKRGGFLLIEDSMGLAAAGAAAQGQAAAAAAAAAGAAGTEEGPGGAAAAAGGGAPKVTGTIIAVLYDDQIKQLMRLPGVW